MSKPLLSILLPCFNGSATLGFALHSLLTQTFTDFEILFLNDGSDDDSAAIATSFGDSRIHILGDDCKRGLPIRLNQGVALAKGHFIARMDADDVSFPARFEKQVAFLASHPAVDLVGCRAVAFRGEADTIGLLPFAATHAELCARPWRNIPLPHPSWMGRTGWFKSHLYLIPEVQRAEDQELLLRSCKDSQFACLDDVLLAYRQGPFQLRRSLIARKSLLIAQCSIFLHRKEWKNLVLSMLSGMLKVAIDGLSALPGLQRLYFYRIKETVPPEVKMQLAACLTACGGKSL